MPSDKPTSLAAWMESLAFRAWHDTLFLDIHATLTLGFSLRTQGERNIPAVGPALIVANHQSYLDPPMICLAARRRLVYLARKSLFRNRLFGALLRSLNAVPIDQEGIGKEGIKMILDQLGLGKPVVVFPEGERTWDGNMQPLKAGIHLLIKRTRAPIVPVGIAGAYDAWPRWRAFPTLAPLFLPCGSGTISVSVGKPIDARRFAEMPREHALAELFDKIAIEQQHAEKLRRVH